MQDRHPFAFESRKLNEIDWRYTVTFDSTMEYKSGSANTMVNALSRKMEFAAISQPDSSIGAHSRGIFP
ncbi:hypothetical protein EPI10_005695 [Gossypium australe]|uniref:Uncharacterized protein n=1 Tax=Gossypium australe TaxID=47621 RepID=A0A5B6WQ55_9ROSI|nr:hypothetical protein EPI10_005695 [Gossypium australe]